MDFNNEEFGNVSDRLERYATQVGALQAKLEYQEKMSEQERKLDVMGSLQTRLNGYTDGPGRIGAWTFGG